MSDPLSYDLSTDVVEQLMDGHQPPEPLVGWPKKAPNFREQVEALSEELWQNIEVCLSYRNILFARLLEEYGQDQVDAWTLLGSLPDDLATLESALSELIPMAEAMPEGHRLREIFGR